MAHISVKSHDNGAKNPKAHLRKPITDGRRAERADDRRAAGPVRLLRRQRRCACAIVTTPEIARALGKRDLVTVKAMQLWHRSATGVEVQHDRLGRQRTSRTTRIAAAARLQGSRHQQAPRAGVDLMEVHDCFSITELVTMEDLHVSEPGTALRDVLDGLLRPPRVAACPARSTAG
jgi:acetyl-CoA C-acetyltransferase